MLTGASYKEDFNKGVLLVTYIWGYVKESSGVRY